MTVGIVLKLNKLKMNYNIIGLGNSGVEIARIFEQYSQYKIYKIDNVSLKQEKNYLKIPKKKTVEEYEQERIPSLTKFFSNIRMGDKILFIVGGSGMISLASLQILEKIKNTKIKILYVRPDLDLLGAKASLYDKIVFNILQEYSRSGLFEEMIIASNFYLENIIGDVAISEYFKKINETIAGTAHMINVFENIPSIMNNFSTKLLGTRLSTLGIVSVESGEEKLFYDLQNIKEKTYYYYINEEVLENDVTLHKKIKEQIKNKRINGIKVSYGIYSSELKENYCYVVARSSEIQK